MSLGQAISSALSGLQIAQTGVGIVAGNISNAENPGYVRKTLLQTELPSLAGSPGARVVGVAREIDIFVQRQLRAEAAGASYTRTLVNYYDGLQSAFGQPGALNALDQLYNNFTNSLQNLATSPEAIAARTQVMNEASVLVQHLHAMSNDIQQLRSQTEISIRDGVERINQILQQIEQISHRLGTASEQSTEGAALLDQRDFLLAELSGFMDIRATELDHGQISIYTASGVSLYDNKAARLHFDGADTVGPHSLWSADADARTIGTIRIETANGHGIDLIADNSIRSGSLKAYLEMRDETLVQAQMQVDEIAHALATALSNRTIAGVPTPPGPQAGFSLDLTALLNGNTISLDYIDSSGQQQRITIVRTDDAAALPLPDSHTPDPDDRVIGVSLAGGMPGALAALNAALGSTGIVFDNPSGMNLRVMNDGGAHPAAVQSFNASVTTTTFNSGDLSLPFFVDGGTNSFYTNAVTAMGSQKLGFASRIQINSALKADASLLVQYGPGIAAGDPARANFIEQQLTAVTMTFPPATGIGSAAGPYQGTLSDFIRSAIGMQGANAENARRLNEGQEVVLNALQSRYAERSEVNVDSEMANLLVLQNAYGANARVLSAVKEMLQMLMNM